MSDTFAKWNDTELNSFLVEITAEVLRKCDDETNKTARRNILDKAARRKGKWTSQRRWISACRFRRLIPPFQCGKISAQNEVRVLIAGKIRQAVCRTSRASARSRKPFSSRHVKVRKPPRRKRSRNRRQRAAQNTSQRRCYKTSRKHCQNPSDEQRNNRNPRKRRWKLRAVYRRIKKRSAKFVHYHLRAGMSLLQTASIEKNYNLNLSKFAKICAAAGIIASGAARRMRRA